MGLSRRSFLKVSAASGAALVLAACQGRADQTITETPKEGVSVITPAESSPGPVTIPNTEAWFIESKIVSQKYAIFVSYPADYEPPKPGSSAQTTYPVLYLLDANELFGMARAIVHELHDEAKVPNLMIVGIGYPDEESSLIKDLRGRDFTPTHFFPFSYPSTDFPNVSGGAGDFLRFILEELKPEVERRYPAQPAEAALFGHSLGGLFCLYALFHGEGAFNRFVIGSPSIWWDGSEILEEEQAFSDANSSLPAHVYMGAGAQEGSVAGAVDDLALRMRQRNYSGLALETEVFDQEAHVSVIPFVMSRGLRAVFGGSS